MGALGGVPEIGVRLTASGVNDVVLAFKRVRQEAKDTKEQGVDFLTGAMEQLGELMPVVTLGLFIGKMAEAVSSSVDLGVEIGHLSEKTGISTETLSALKYAADVTGVSFETFQRATKKLSTEMLNAEEGNKKSIANFQLLGITQQQVTAHSNDLYGMLEILADKFQTMPDGPQKMAVATALLGKTGLDLIPILNQGSAGLEKMKEEAASLGLILDASGIAKLQEMHKVSAELTAGLQGLSLALTSALGPALISVGGWADGLLVKLHNLFVTLGNAGYDTFKAYSSTDSYKQFIPAGMTGMNDQDILASGQKAQAAADAAQSEYEALEAQHAKGLISTKAYNAKKLALQKEYYTQSQAAAAANYVHELASRSIGRNDNNSGATTTSNGVLMQYGGIMQNASEKLAGLNQSGGGLNLPIDPKAQAAAHKLAAAKAAFEQAMADNMLAIQKTANTLAEQEDKRRYDAGLLTVDQYYDAVEDRIRTNATAEAAAFEAKEAAIKAMPNGNPEDKLKQQTAQANLDREVAQQQMKDEADLGAAESARSAAKLSDQQKLLGLEKQLATASGDRFTAEQDALEKELVDYAALLKKVGELSDAQQKAKVDAARTAGTAKINFGRDQQAGSDTMASLNEGVAGIQNQAANGSISNITAEARILQLEKDRLVALRAIGTQMAADALLSGDPAAIAAAQKYNASLDVMQSKLQNVTTAQTEFENQLSGQGYQDLVNFFAAGISGSKSFGAALGDLATAFEGIVSRMISQLLVYYTVMALVGWIAPGSSFFASLVAKGPFGMGFADGGYTGDIPANQVAGVVHGKEFVFDAQTTAKNRPMFDMIAAGRMPNIVTPHAIAASMSSTYTASLAADNAASPYTAPAPIIQITNTTGQPVSQKQSTGAGGQSITEIIIGTVATNIKSGGLVHKTLAGTYGVSRKGVLRG